MTFQSPSVGANGIRPYYMFLCVSPVIIGDVYWEIILYPVKQLYQFEKRMLQKGTPRSDMLKNS
ncbi:MAG: hypothetical protein F6K17_09685 [Okeania sp. SIO3C4]|nr:hypothetical protein [Okeania sp. SIO3B3]NER02872.1 hypothetical protein [Okeania sp. SIO3C4]